MTTMSNALVGQELRGRLFHLLHGHLLDNPTVVTTSGLAQRRKSLTGATARRYRLATAVIVIRRSRPRQGKAHRCARMTDSGRHPLPR